MKNKSFISKYYFSTIILSLSFATPGSTQEHSLLAEQLAKDLRERGCPSTPTETVQWLSWAATTGDASLIDAFKEQCLSSTFLDRATAYAQSLLAGWATGNFAITSASDSMRPFSWHPSVGSPLASPLSREPEPLRHPSPTLVSVFYPPQLTPEDMAPIYSTAISQGNFKFLERLIDSSLPRPHSSVILGAINWPEYQQHHSQNYPFLNGLIDEFTQNIIKDIDKLIEEYKKNTSEEKKNEIYSRAAFCGRPGFIDRLINTGFPLPHPSFVLSAINWPTEYQHEQTLSVLKRMLIEYDEKISNEEKEELLDKLKNTDIKTEQQKIFFIKLLESFLEIPFKKLENSFLLQFVKISLSKIVEEPSKPSEESLVNDVMRQLSEHSIARIYELTAQNGDREFYLKWLQYPKFMNVFSRKFIHSNKYTRMCLAPTFYQAILNGQYKFVKDIISDIMNVYRNKIEIYHNGKKINDNKMTNNEIEYYYEIEKYYNKSISISFNKIIEEEKDEKILEFIRQFLPFISDQLYFDIAFIAYQQKKSLFDQIIKLTFEKPTLLRNFLVSARKSFDEYSYLIKEKEKIRNNLLQERTYSPEEINPIFDHVKNIFKQKLDKIKEIINLIEEYINKNNKQYIPSHFPRNIMSPKELSEALSQISPKNPN